MEKEASAIDDANAIAPLLAKIVLYIGNEKKTVDDIAEYADIGIKFLKDSISFGMFVRISNDECWLNYRGIALLADELCLLLEEKVKALDKMLQIGGRFYTQIGLGV